MTCNQTRDQILRWTVRQREVMYETLSARSLPQGTFDGFAFDWHVGWLWYGKIFTGSKVVNRTILGPLFEGEVSLRIVREAKHSFLEEPSDEWVETTRSSDVVIYYPLLHLTDTLRQLDRLRWLGRAHVFGHVAWFLLEERYGDAA